MRVFDGDGDGDGDVEIIVFLGIGIGIGLGDRVNDREGFRRCEYHLFST